MRIRVTFIGADDSQITIETRQYNEELELRTKEWYEKRCSKSCVMWTQCDDAEALWRIFGAVSIGPEGDRLELATDLNKSQYVCVSDMKKMVWQGMQEKKQEIEFTTLHYAPIEGVETKVFGLVDLSKGVLYGVRFDLKTLTSATTEYFLVPKLASK
jgi:hypothetical protein